MKHLSDFLKEVKLKEKDLEKAISELEKALEQLPADFEIE